MSTDDPGKRLDVDGLIVDLDGVVMIGNEPVAGSVSALGDLTSLGVPLVFLTNNPVRSRASWAARLKRLGLAVTARDVVTSASALAALIRAEHGPGAAVLAIGSRSLKRDLAAAGLTLTAAQRAAAVAVGGHPGFNYRELRTATQAVRRGARLYGAGRDAVYPMPDGPWPATGAILAAVEAAAGTQAVVAGKPELHIFRLARSLLPGRRVAMVGDHLEADIVGGKRAGLATILVLTGTTSPADLETAAVDPDVVVPDLAAAVDLLKESAQ